MSEQTPAWLTSQMTYRARTAPWPANVHARYLTVGGATVDTVETDEALTSTCGGCHARGVDYFDPMCTGSRMENHTRGQAHAWAQAHAEKCRALPRPGTAVTR
ncbi:hypothetical protein ABZ650_20470 [Streptomyces griseoviridis]|uniref:hypothetical protein n=1 Tax=Streptomyces griseoviridis TaxID=45398 RepID=UPI0033F17AC5